MTVTAVKLCVGTGGPGLFAAHFRGPDDLPVRWSGAIQVHRASDGHYAFACWGKSWPERYRDIGAARWYDDSGAPCYPATGGVAETASQRDYYDIILPAIDRLERSLSSEADPADLVPARIGLSNCWDYREKS